MSLFRWILANPECRSDILLAYLMHGFGVLRFALILAFTWPLILMGWLARKWKDPFDE